MKKFDPVRPGDDEATRLAKHIAHDRMYCQHYDPAGITMIGGKEPHGYCKAGVVYLDQFGRAPDDGNHDVNGRYYPSSGIFQRICCTSGNENTEAEQLAKCPKWERRTIEQATKRHEEIEASMARMRMAGTVVKEWRTWTKQNRVAKQGVIDCPTKCGGKLHLSQAAYNGHVWGKCTTEGCLSWME